MIGVSRQSLGFIIGLLAFTILLFMPQPDGMSADGQNVLAITVLMAIWWISEALPLGITSLIPIVLYPAFGIMTTASASAPFAHYVNFLILGGFFIGATLEKWNLHKRIALSIICKIGTSPPMIMLGFMLSTYFLSMWISNVATAIMMVPIGLTVIEQVSKTDAQKNSVSNEIRKKFSIGLMLCIAYAANIGGMSTLIGTPCNAVLAGMVSEMYSQDITFVDWFVLAFPFGIIMLFLTWIYLSKVSFKIDSRSLNQSKDVIEQELRSLGAMSKEEIWTLVILTLTVFCWVFRGVVKPESLSMINDATIAVFFAILLFIIPVNRKKNEFLLDWKTAVKVPWGILLLIGGGLSLAGGVKSSELDVWLVSHLSKLQGADLYLIIFAVVTLTVFLTEITSNVATTTILIPMLSGMAGAMMVHPYALILAAGISASFAFMLPMATPGNSIIFACKHITVPDMVKTGFILNIAGMALIPLLIFYYLPWVWNVDITRLPEWVSVMLK